MFNSLEPWLQCEDDTLRKLVEVHGTNSWTQIADFLPERSGKQCRERWHNHLNPGIKKGNWTAEEDQIIITMQKVLGNQWAMITKMLPGRTDNAVKNRFHATERARVRAELSERHSPATLPPHYGAMQNGPPMNGHVHNGYGNHPMNQMPYPGGMQKPVNGKHLLPAPQVPPFYPNSEDMGSSSTDYSNDNGEVEELDNVMKTVRTIIENDRTGGHQMPKMQQQPMQAPTQHQVPPLQLQHNGPPQHHQHPMYHHNPLHQHRNKFRPSPHGHRPQYKRPYVRPATNVSYSPETIKAIQDSLTAYQRVGKETNEQENDSTEIQIPTAVPLSTSAASVAEGPAVTAVPTLSLMPYENKKKLRFVPIIDGFPSPRGYPDEGMANKKQRTNDNNMQLPLSSLPRPEYSVNATPGKQQDFDDDFENLLNDIALMITPRFEGIGISPRLEMLSPRLAAALAATTSTGGGIQNLIHSKSQGSSAIDFSAVKTLKEETNGITKTPTAGPEPPNTARSTYSLNLSLYDGDICDWLSDYPESGEKAKRESPRATSSH